MNKDIRISVDFFQHHKTKRLRRKLGWEGVIALQQLWCYAAKHRPEGALSGMDAEDIADVCDLEGDPQAFVTELCDIGFLEQCEEGVYQLHDWEENNPWAANARERSERARKAAKVKHRKEKDCATHAGSMPDACAEHADGTKEQGSSTAGPHAPSPSPSPSPLRNRRGNGNEETDPQKEVLFEIPTRDGWLRLRKYTVDKWQKNMRYIDAHAELVGLEEWAKRKEQPPYANSKSAMCAISKNLQQKNQKQLSGEQIRDPTHDPADPDGSQAAREAERKTKEHITEISQSWRC